MTPWEQVLRLRRNGLTGNIQLRGELIKLDEPWDLWRVEPVTSHRLDETYCV
jgi:hypothetical protein